MGGSVHLRECQADAIACTPLGQAEIRLEACSKGDVCRQGCPEKAIDIAEAKRNNGS